MRRSCLLALALAGVATPALAQPQAPLPDFPTMEARPGECWARRPIGPAPMSGPPGQAVWTLERGSGPGAVWNRSDAPAGPAHARGAPLDWARVDCRSGAVLGFAEGPPPPTFHADAPPPLPPYAGPAYAQRFEPPQGPHLPPPYHLPHGPYADPRPAPHAGPVVGPYADPLGPPPPPPPVLHHAPAPFLHAAHPPLRPFPAPLFGARFLHWPGKTLR